MCLCGVCELPLVCCVSLMRGIGSFLWWRGWSCCVFGVASHRVTVGVVVSPERPNPSLVETPLRGVRRFGRDRGRLMIAGIGRVALCIGESSTSSSWLVVSFSDALVGAVVRFKRASFSCLSGVIFIGRALA